MRIRQLPDDLVNKIAAGEVIERPASIVKELVENALDAGATRIVVTTSAGGKSLIRIEDNGHGMGEVDLRLSVSRHATSKLKDDALDDIQTLGFRGEALASISAVAELTIATRAKDEELGLKLSFDGPRIVISPNPMPQGTVVEVKSLFKNVPARLKFLKSDRAEANAITDIMRRLAMSEPHIQFVLQGSDRQTTNWPAQTGDSAAKKTVLARLWATTLQPMLCRLIINVVPCGSLAWRHCRPTPKQIRSLSSTSSMAALCATKF